MCNIPYECLKHTLVLDQIYKISCFKTTRLSLIDFNSINSIICKNLFQSKAIKTGHFLRVCWTWRIS